MLRSINSELVFIVSQIYVTPGVNVITYLLADLVRFMLEVLNYLNISINFVDFLNNLLEFFAGFFINTIVYGSLQLLFA